jgi:hypothetical protein
MAGLDATKLQELRAMYPNNFVRLENRGQKDGLLDLALANAMNPQGIINADIMDKARRAWGRDAKIPALTGTAAANGTGLSCTFGDNTPISELVALTFATVSNGFQMKPQVYYNNEISYEQTRSWLYTKAIREMAKAIDALFDTTLTANIATAAEYNNPYAGTKYPFVANKLQVSLAQQPYFFADMTAINASDDLEDERFDIVGSTNLQPTVRLIFNQGESNDENTAYQAGDFDFRFSNRVIPTPVTSTSSFFVLPKGAIVVMSQNNPINLENGGRTTGDGKTFGTLFDPTLGMLMDTLYEDNCADVSGITGNPRDTASIVEGYQMAVHFAILTPYTDFATSGVPSTIRKVDFLAA